MRPLLLACSLLLLAASVACASTINLRWSNCWGDGGAANRSFACDTNSGSQSLVGSFISPVAVPGVIAHEFIVELGFTSASVPAWWMFKNAETCRQSSLAIQPTPPATAVQCIDWANTAALGLIASYLAPFATNFPNLARIAASTSVASEAAGDLAAGQEYFSFQLTINNAKTVGMGSCAGCDVGVCITLRQIRLRTLDGLHDQFLHIGAKPGDQPGDARVLWQLTNPSAICDLATPIRNRTWGDVKALYR